MTYLKVQTNSRCDDCGRPLQPLSHFRICPKCLLHDPETLATRPPETLAAP
jgi:Zn finger protein HypA/HybF involved in hydrogenase expression